MQEQLIAASVRHGEDVTVDRGLALSTEFEKIAEQFEQATQIIARKHACEIFDEMHERVFKPFLNDPLSEAGAEEIAASCMSIADGVLGTEEAGILALASAAGEREWAAARYS